MSDFDMSAWERQIASWTPEGRASWIRNMKNEAKNREPTDWEEAALYTTQRYVEEHDIGGHL